MMMKIKFYFIEDNLCRIMGKIILVALIVGVLGGVGRSASAQSAKTLRDYLWQHRILLLFSPSADHMLLQQQVDLWQANVAGLNERDILIFHVFPDQVKGADAWDGEAPQKLRQQYQVESHEFCVILIGKDGSEKMRTYELLPQKELYAVVDAMPMRQREMREAKNNR